MAAAALIQAAQQHVVIKSSSHSWLALELKGFADRGRAGPVWQISIPSLILPSLILPFPPLYTQHQHHPLSLLPTINDETPFMSLFLIAKGSDQMKFNCVCGTGESLQGEVLIEGDNIQHVLALASEHTPTCLCPFPVPILLNIVTSIFSLWL